MKTNLAIQVFGVAAILLNTSLANASLITFNLDGNSLNQPTISQSVAGLNVTFANASFQGSNRNFRSDPDGLAVLDGPFGFGVGIDHFEVTFDQTVRLVSYMPSYSHLGGDENLTLSAGGFSSSETVFKTGVLTNFSNQFIVLAGQSISLASDFGATTEFDLLQISQLTVDTISPVPVPGAVWLFGYGLIGLIGMRKKLSKASTPLP